MKQANRILIAVIVMVMSISFAAAAGKYIITDEGNGVVSIEKPCTGSLCQLENYLGKFKVVEVGSPKDIPGSAIPVSDTESYDITSKDEKSGLPIMYRVSSSTSGGDGTAVPPAPVNTDDGGGTAVNNGGGSPDLDGQSDNDGITNQVYVNNQPPKFRSKILGQVNGGAGGPDGPKETFTVKLMENGDYQVYSNLKEYGDYYTRNEVKSTDEIPGFSDLAAFKISDTEYFDPVKLKYYVINPKKTETPKTVMPSDTSEFKPNLLTALHRLGSWGSAAAGWEWGVNLLFPDASKQLRQAFALDTFTFPSTLEEAYCEQVTQPEANANDQTMLGTDAGKLPSLMLQAIRSAAIKYPKETTTTILPTVGLTTTTETTTTVEDDILTEGIVPSPSLPLYGTRYYTKITLRYQGIIDPLLTGKDKTYELHMYGYTGSKKRFIDLDTESEETYLEMSDGSYSLSDKNAIIKYIKYKLDKVCVEFVDTEYMLDPLFLKKLTNNMFCTPVVEVKDKWLEYEKPQVRQSPESPDDVV